MGVRLTFNCFATCTSDSRLPGASTPSTIASRNEITGPMFDAMIAALRSEATLPVARVLRIRARGDVFCTGRERAGTDAASLHREVSRLIELKRLLRASPMISIAEVQGDA